MEKRTSHAINDLNESKLINEIKGYKKIKVEDLKDKRCELQEYFKFYNLKDARTKFALDTKMLPTIKSHFPSEKAFLDELLKCEKCERVDTIKHIKICPGYEMYRKDKDMNNDIDVVHFFQEVINSRMEINLHDRIPLMKTSNRF